MNKISPTIRIGMKQISWWVFASLLLISNNLSLAANLLPTPQDAALEILETQTFTPEFSVNDNEWVRLASNEEMKTACFALLKRAGNSNSFTFIKDTTGKNVIRYRGFLKPRMICEGNNIWVWDYVGDNNGKMILAKYSVNGDLLFRVGFAKPAAPKGEFLGNIMDPTLKSEDGYLSFQWWFRQSNRATYDGKQYVKQILKVRLREPDSLAHEKSMALAEKCPRSDDQIKTITHANITKCPAATVIVEDEYYLERYQSCPGYTEEIQHEGLYYQGKENSRLSLPALGDIYPSNKELQGFNAGEIQCESDSSISVIYLNGGNCEDCEQKVLYKFDSMGNLIDSHLIQTTK